MYAYFEITKAAASRDLSGTDRYTWCTKLLIINNLSQKQTCKPLVKENLETPEKTLEILYFPRSNHFSIEGTRHQHSGSERSEFKP